MKKSKNIQPIRYEMFDPEDDIEDQNAYNPQ